MAHKYALNGAIVGCIIYMATIMIASPVDCIVAAENGLKICTNIVIPALFPFVFCGNMFISLGAARIMSRTLSKIMQPIFGVPGAGALALILGLVSGYPVGAICAASLYKSGECTKHEAEKLMRFTNNSGPMFVIGAIGVKMFKSYKIGVLMYIVHVLSAVLCGIIFRSEKTLMKETTLPPARDSAEIKTAAPDIGAAIVKSVNTILMICGFIIVFSVFTAKIPDFVWRGYIYSLFEITGGLSDLISYNNSLSIIPVVAFMTAFSGLSVVAQVYAITESAGLSVKPYIVGKLIQGLIAFVLMYLCIWKLPIDTTVYMQMDTIPVFAYTPRDLFGYALISVAFCAASVLILVIIAKLFENHEK